MSNFSWAVVTVTKDRMGRAGEREGKEREKGIYLFETQVVHTSNSKSLKGIMRPIRAERQVNNYQQD